MYNQRICKHGSRLQCTMVMGPAYGAYYTKTISQTHAPRHGNMTATHSTATHARRVLPIACGPVGMVAHRIEWGVQYVAHKHLSVALHTRTHLLLAVWVLAVCCVHIVHSICTDVPYACASANTNTNTKTRALAPRDTGQLIGARTQRNSSSTVNATIENHKGSETFVRSDNHSFNGSRNERTQNVLRGANGANFADFLPAKGLYSSTTQWILLLSGQHSFVIWSFIRYPAKNNIVDLDIFFATNQVSTISMYIPLNPLTCHIGASCPSSSLITWPPPCSSKCGYTITYS